MERVVSGVRPTGNIHLGNYFGAIKNFVALQEQCETFFFIADYHALTTHPNASELQDRIKETLATYLACGLNPDKTTLYIQSHIPEIPELYLIFNMLAHLGELERSTTFKDKVAKQQSNINAGLLTYPVLMAVDIIIHRATKVPVGKDQEQHLEMTRNFVNRFNHLYETDFFPEPEAFNFNQALVKVPGLDGKGKMGKSEGANNAVYLIEDPKAIQKKVMRAVTDSGPKEKNSPVSEPVANLFKLMELVSEPDVLNNFKEDYANCSIRYGDLKKQLAQDIIKFTDPLRSKIQYYLKEEDLLRSIVQKGAEKAHESAGETLSGVKKIIGLKAL
ncbi:MAG: tryptophan--tRNA ligase [Chitinophagales bacterium]